MNIDPIERPRPSRRVLRVHFAPLDLAAIERRALSNVRESVLAALRFAEVEARIESSLEPAPRRDASPAVLHATAPLQP
ncbi:MAG: hypothetical protein VYE22_17345 [Myxococcota bacterium]|nr:hypothetical protein [Myxococcota bacterium]